MSTNAFILRCNLMGRVDNGEAMSPAEEMHCMLTSSENALLEESLRGKFPSNRISWTDCINSGQKIYSLC